MPHTSLAPTRSLRLLFVDDDENLRVFMAMLLESLGHTTEVAGDGREGLQRFSTERFDVVITDLLMPKLDGWGLAAAIKAFHPSQPIVMLTGFAESLPVGGPMKAVDLVLAKPAGIDVLADALERVTEGAARAA